MVLHRFLTEQEEHLLQEERRQLGELRDVVARLGADAADLALLDNALAQLDQLFLLVVVGEFNSGKSAFINALLGQRFLAEGVTPTTAQVHILRHGPVVSRDQSQPDLAVITYPVEWLQDINIVDTPGTNAIIQQHQEITERFVPRADLVLFVTSTDRPFTESERLFMQRIREWGKKVVVVVNKIDILEGPEDITSVVNYVRDNAERLLGSEPMIFPVSARLARQAKEADQEDERARLWRLSLFEPLETFILRTLDENERLKLKLSSPLGIGQRLIARHLGVVHSRTDLLRSDLTTIDNIHSDLTGYEADMRRDFKYHLSHIDNVLYAMTERGDRFFDETVRITRIFDLINAERVRGAFEREVVSDTSNQVEEHTHELIDWLVQQDYRQWQAIMGYLNKQMAQHEGQIVGQAGGQFEFDRQALLRSVGRAARETVASYDKESEARALAESVQVAVAQTALVEVGAIGLGALLVKLLATTVADVSGVLAASLLAAMGLYVIPNKRRQAKATLHARVTDVRARLSSALTTQFEDELRHSIERIQSAIRPYTRFVEAQRNTLADSESALKRSSQALQDLAGQIAALGSAVRQGEGGNGH